MADRSERESLISAVGYVVRHLESAEYRYVGVLRRVLRELVDVEPTVEPGAVKDACPQCGRPVKRATRGRPRVYCSDSCRHRARYSA